MSAKTGVESRIASEAVNRALGERLRATVLIVDDIAENRQLLVRFMRRQGCSTIEAAGGQEALDTVADEEVDLVLLDIMMPDIDGLEVVRRLRSRYSAGELPIIMVTALDDQQSVLESLSLGANDFVTKPIDFPILLLRSSTQLERKFAEREVRKLNTQLEERVEQRTAELRRAYNVLKEESEQRRRARKMLRESEELYRALYDDNPTTFFTIDESLKVISANKYGATQLGYEVDELIGSRFRDLHWNGDGKIVDGAIEECLSCGDTRTWEARLLHKEGRVTWVRTTGKTIVSRNGAMNVMLVCEDITEARELSEQLSYEARHDALTGIYNRREFELRLQGALDSVRKDSAARHTLCYVDLDQFKVINDNCGHIGGDELLRQLAASLKKMLRQGDVIARLGGDEFGVLLQNCSVENAEKVADDIRRNVSEFRFAWDGKSYTLAASIGVVVIDDAMNSMSQIMLAADTACYAAKDGGRDRIHLYRPDDEELAQRHGEMQWVIKIKRALEQDRFRLYAQAIRPLSSDSQAYHYEVLVRMLDDDDTLAPPGAFLPAAERYNISSNIDRWVVRSTLDWLQAHPQHLEKLELCSINLSGQTLGDTLLLHEIMAHLSEYSVPPEVLCFEITETAAIANLQTAQEFIESLRSRGCRFALDDFGSGLSSFAYLKNLPVDFLKIDGVFVKNIADDPVNQSIVRSIHEVARVMGKKTVAEFVENDEIADILTGIGVDFAQGYGIAKPVPLDELAESAPTEKRASG